MRTIEENGIYTGYELEQILGLPPDWIVKMNNEGKGPTPTPLRNPFGGLELRIVYTGGNVWLWLNKITFEAKEIRDQQTWIDSIERDGSR